ncbi:MAG: hypothetical protein ACOYXY_22355 [Thermodesulfobacteriota bacterium]
MPPRSVRLFFCLMTAILAFAPYHSGFSQGLASSPQFGNPFAAPRFADSGVVGGTSAPEGIPLSSGMFPGLFSGIPHLKAGFAYSFGKNVRYGRGIIDYLLPMDIAPATTLFGELHAEFQDFWKTPAGSVVAAPGARVSGYRDAPVPSQQRYDLSVGGGFRRGVSADSILGVNAFFDASKVQDRWYSSGGLGLEFVSRLPGDGLIDLNFNYYGNLFSGTDFVNAVRYGAGNFDIEAGYSRPLFNQALDLRLKAAGYQFDVGQKVYGWSTGADATTRDGLFRLTYEYTSDRINAPYHTIVGSVQLGLRLENLLRGESPFTLPDPVFAGPRNVSRIFHEHVKRRWSQPTQIVQRRTSPSIIFLGLTFSPGVWTSVTNVNVAAASFEVVKSGGFIFPVPDGVFVAYQFKMSDGSSQKVIGTVTKVSDPDGIVAAYEWFPSGATTLGPAMMDNPAGSSTDLTFGQAHAIYLFGPSGTGPAIITITISVPDRPDIAPLVITCTASNA